MYSAGQIGPFEWVLIGLGILWLAGMLRKVIYVPVIIKDNEKKEEVSNETKISEDVTVSKPPKNSDSGEYVPFEEIKD